MAENIIVVEDTILPDGHLEVVEKLPLSTGKVRVTVETLEPSSQTESELIELFAAIRNDPPERSREENDAYIKAMRDEAEEEMIGIRHLQDSLGSSEE